MLKSRAFLVAVGYLHYGSLITFTGFYLNSLQIFNIWPLSPLFYYLNISKREFTKARTSNGKLPGC